MRADAHRFLVVDDDPDIQQVLVDLLFSLGYTADAVGLGRDAIDRVRAAEYDLVLLDQALPDIPGADVLRQIKHISPNTEVIIVTGQSSLDSAIAAVRFDAFDYLEKPFGVGVLAEAVEKAIHRRRGRLEEHHRLEALVRQHELERVGDTPTRAASDRALWESVVRDCPDALVAAGTDRVIRLANDAAVRLIGLPASEMVGRPIESLIELGEYEDLVWGALDTRDSLTGFETFIVNRCTDRRIPVEINWSVLRDGDGMRIGALAVCRDVTVTRPLLHVMNEANQELQALAVSDPVTGLYNHRHFQAALRVEVERARRHNRSTSLLMIDVDLFKPINDTYGHAFGDEVLRELARAIEGELRATDVPCRYGGDEFAVVLPETDADEARRVAQRMLDTVRALPVRPPRGSEALRLSLSIGVATYPEDGETAGDLIASADSRLYLAKQSGRSQVAAETERPGSLAR